MKSHALILLLCALISLFSGLNASAAIFGIDDRIQVIQGNPAQAHMLARATAIAVLSANFEITANNKIKLNVDHFDELLCKAERFSNQPTLSYACSGFLVAPDIIATAGHCMVNTGVSQHETELYCKAFSWLFDFNQKPDGAVQTENITQENLYHCKEVIYAIKDEQMPFKDFALVRLNRPVKGRNPLKLAQSEELVAPFSMIGYPLGTPAKITHSAQLLMNNLKRESFITSLDAFEGNSGSVVFNSKSEVVGILVGGTPVDSTAKRQGQTCEVYNRCDERGANCLSPDTNTSVLPGYQRVGSEVQRIRPLREMLKLLLQK